MSADADDVPDHSTSGDMASSAIVLPMEIELSGRVAMTVDGCRVDIGPAKCQALLATLALSAGRPVSVPELVAALWGEDPPRTAEKTLQTYVGQLRKSLGADRIERSGMSYRLDLAEDDVDLNRFERLLDSGEVASAIQLWKGLSLGGLDAPGLDAVVSGLTERYLEAVEQDLGDQIDRGAAGALVGRLTQLTAEHPLREGLWVLLMTALYRAGRQAEALRAFGTARDHLVEQLGIEPGSELQRLEAQVLEQDPKLDRPTTTSSGPSGDSIPDERQPGPAVRTFLFTDIEASTRLWDTDAEAMRSFVECHDDTLSTAIASHGGQVFKSTGDGLLAMFNGPSSGVEAAVAAQRELGRLAGPRNEPVRIRMALATGRATPRDGDWFGPPLNLAARLLEASHGGQILCSDATATSVGNQLRGDIELAPLGIQRLRGLARPESVSQALQHDLQRTFPPLRTVVEAERDDGVPFPSALDFTRMLTLVGREEPLARLTALLDRVVEDDRPAIALLAGEPGIGKTRLAAEVARRAAADGAIVLYGRCDEHTVTSYQPWLEALRSYTRSRPDQELRGELGSGASEIARLLPELVDRYPDLSPPAELEGDDARLLIFDAVTRLLERAAAEPMVLVLDDIHWADASSLAMLVALLRNAERGRLLLVGTYRDVEVDRRHPLGAALGDLRRLTNVETMVLRGLDFDEVVAMTEAMLDRELGPTADDTLRQLVDTTQGNPFFLHEYLTHLMDIGVLERREGQWRLAPEADPTAVVPEGVRDVVGRRLDRLDEDCNRMLSTASVIGSDIDVGVLAEVLGLQEDEVLDLLDAALEAGVLAEATGRRETFDFAHALMRQTLYEELSTPRRSRLHRRIGDAIERLHASHLDAHLAHLARHFYEGSAGTDDDRALIYLRRAAEQAEKRLAFEEAIRLSLQVITVLDDRDAPEAEGIDDEIRIGRTLCRLGAEEAASHFERAIALAATLPDLDRQVAIAVVWFQSLGSTFDRASSSQAVPLLTAIDRLRSQLHLDDLTAPVMTLDVLKLSTTLVPDPNVFAASITKAASEHPDPEIRAMALAAAYGHDPTFPLPDDAKIEELFHQTTGTAASRYVISLGYRASVTIGSNGGLVTWGRRSLENARRTGDPASLGGMAAVAWSAAELELAGEIRAAIRADVRPASTSSAMEALMSAHEAHDRDQKLPEEVLVDLREYESSRHLHVAWATLPALGAAYLAGDDDLLDAAVRSTRARMGEWLESIPALRLYGSAILAQTLRASGDPSDAELLREQLAMGAGHAGSGGVICVGAFDRYSALCSELLGDLNRAIDEHEAARRVHEDIGYRRERLVGDLDLIGALRSRGTAADLARARELVDLDLPLADQLGLERYQRCYRELDAELK